MPTIEIKSSLHLWLGALATAGEGTPYEAVFTQAIVLLCKDEGDTDNILGACFDHIFHKLRSNPKKFVKSIKKWSYENLKNTNKSTIDRAVHQLGLVGDVIKNLPSNQKLERITIGRNDVLITVQFIVKAPTAPATTSAPAA